MKLSFLSLLLLIFSFPSKSFAQIEVYNGGEVRIGRVGIVAPLHTQVEVDYSTRFRCFDLSNNGGTGFLIKNYPNSTGDDPIIEPWFGGSMWIGRPEPDPNIPDKYIWKTHSNELYLKSQPVIQSDGRFKKNLRQLPYGLETILKINPVMYDFEPKTIGMPEARQLEILENGKDNIGFIAQELDSIIPAIVQVQKEGGTYGVQYSGLIPVLVKAIQEQQAQIDELKTLLNSSLGKD